MGCASSKEAEPAAVAAPADLAAQKKAQEEQKKAADAKAAEEKRLEQERLKKHADEEEARIAAAKAEEERVHAAALAEAAAREKEANEAAAQAIALQIADRMADNMLEEAAEAGVQAKEEQSKNVMENFKGMGAKIRFREAISNGYTYEAREAGAEMLQGAWRCKVARRKMVAKKAEKLRLLKDGSIKKIQGWARISLARKRVAAKRAEKERLLAEEHTRHAAELANIAVAEAQLEEVKAQIEEEPIKTEDVTPVIVAPPVVVPKKPVPPAMKTGPIKKEGQMIKNWNSRHFVLLSTDTETTFKYYLRSKTSPPFGEEEKGSVTLKGATTERLGKLFCVTDAGGRILKLDFNNENEKEAWIAAITAHINWVNGLKK